MMGAVVEFVSPWGDGIVGGEVIEADERFLAVDYQGSIIVLHPVADDEGVHKVMDW